MFPYTCRPLCRDDWPEVLGLLTDVVAITHGDASAALRIGLAENPEDVLGDAAYWQAAQVASSGGRLVGVSLARLARVEALWVLPDFHRAGIGSTLLVHAENEIRRAGHGTAHLNVGEANTHAIRFYESHGWVRGEGYLHPRWKFPMLRMAKNLQIPHVGADPQRTRA